MSLTLLGDNLMYKLELEIALELDEALPSAMTLLERHIEKIDRFTFRTNSTNFNPEVKIWSKDKEPLLQILEVYFDCPRWMVDDLDLYIETE
jgi:hypothetical protein